MVGIYHDQDLDGLACKALLQRFYPGIHPIGWDYKYYMTEEVLEVLNEADEIVMADVTLPREYMMSFADKISLYDHHETAWNKFRKLPLKEYHYAQDRAACEVLWYAHMDQDAPDIINLLGSYDIWRHNGTPLWHEEILPVQLYLRMKFDRADKMIQAAIDDDGRTAEFRDRGAQLLEFERAQFVMPARHMKRVEISGVPFMAVNATLNPGRFMDYVRDEYGYNRICVYYQVGDQWKYSLRSVAPLTVNDVAESFMGGGHPQAAGFSTKELIF